MKKNYILLALVVILLLVAGCVPGPNTAARTPDEDGNVAGFWMGLWHGFIAPTTFIISIFTSSVNFYEVHNSGNWYNLAFVLSSGTCCGILAKVLAFVLGAGVGILANVLEAIKRRKTKTNY